jgi:hypothetical protein
MTIDLDKVSFSSAHNAYKNDDQVYSGTITLPTSLLASASSTTTSTFSVATPPVFSEFYAQFTEVLDLLQYAVGTYGNPQWYSIDFAATGDIGIWVTAPGPFQSVITANLIPVINGTSISVQATITNPYSTNITLGALSIPFRFVTYSLAN